MLRRLVLSTVLVAAGFPAPVTAQGPSPSDCWAALALVPLEKLALPAGSHWDALALTETGWSGWVAFGPELGDPAINVHVTCWPDPVVFIERSAEVAAYSGDTTSVSSTSRGDASYAIRVESSIATSTTISWADGRFVASVGTSVLAESGDVADQAAMEEVATAVQSLLDAPSSGGSAGVTRGRGVYRDPHARPGRERDVAGRFRVVGSGDAPHRLVRPHQRLDDRGVHHLWRDTDGCAGRDAGRRSWRP